MLSPYRVLDLTNERGLLCGQLLGDLGADVIQIEPPGGSPARRIGPFYGDTPDPDRSIFWWAHSRNKRSLVLDIETEEGRTDFRSLVDSADFLIDSFDPGYMAERGLDYEALAATNPTLVYVSITPFGQTGPKSGYAESDLILGAASGPVALTGDDDRPPLRVGAPQAYAHASADAAVAALIAHHERERSGRGQHVDVSAQQALEQATLSTTVGAALGTVDIQRLSGGSKYGPLLVRGVYPAKDGYVGVTFFFGNSVGPMTARLMKYIHEQGFCDEATRDIDWIGYGDSLLSGKEPIDRLKEHFATIERFTSSMTKAELTAAALEHQLLIAPIATVDEVAASEQLMAREYWQSLEHPEIGASIRYPGAFAKFSATPIRHRRRPPLVGEHTKEVLNESTRNPSKSEAADGDSNGEPPLAGLKVVDFMWVMAGPGATRILADYGATVIRVETSKRIDTARTLVPFVTGQPGPENSVRFHDMNAGKLGVTLDLARPEAREVVLDLVRWADIVTESFSPKVMKGWGLDYESLRAVKPEIIMLSTCLMGQSGPLSRFAGFGSLAACTTGFYDLTGWPDRAPAGPFGAYTDTIAPRFTALAILAALEHRHRTGEGQYIDQSQAESALHFLGPALIDYMANGRVQHRDSNRDPGMAPHGIYPASDDRWIAIAIKDEGQWAKLCEAMSQVALVTDPRFETLAARKSNEDALDEVVAAWTSSRDAFETELFLQSSGTPAHVVLNSTDLYNDSQLQHRGHFVQTDHPMHGKVTVSGSHFKLSRTPAHITKAAPMYGEHNFEVLEGILGYSSERVADLAASGALE
jgi:crotonobetainyl-CoA:carnitine CoA-transferase CaiB-like acyl-CoA transferase